MGQLTSSPTVDLKIQHFLDQHTFQRNLADTRYFTDSKLLSKKDNPKENIAFNEMTFFKESVFNQFVNKLDARLTNEEYSNCPNINKFQTYFISQTPSTYCQPIYKVFLVFEYVGLDLFTEITERAKKQQYFTEDELLQLIEGIVNVNYILDKFFIKGLLTLQLNQISHQCLRPQTISLKKDKDQIIPIVSDASLIQCVKNIQIIQNSPQQIRKQIYISPIQLQSIHHCNNTMRMDVYKNDLFTLGMILLGAANLQNCSDCYEILNGVINIDKLTEKLESLNGRYSPKIINMLKHMIELEEEKRRDFIHFKQSAEINFEDDINTSDNLESDCSIIYEIKEEKKEEIVQEQIQVNEKKEDVEDLQSIPQSNEKNSQINDDQFEKLSSKSVNANENFQNNTQQNDQQSLRNSEQKDERIYVQDIKESSNHKQAQSVVSMEILKQSEGNRNNQQSEIYNNELQLDFFKNYSTDLKEPQNLLKIEEQNQTIQQNLNGFNKLKQNKYSGFLSENQGSSENSSFSSCQLQYIEMQSKTRSQTQNISACQKYLLNQDTFRNSTQNETLKISPRYQELPTIIETSGRIIQSNYQSRLQSIEKEIQSYCLKNYELEPDGSRYRGEKLNNMKHGFGKIFFHNGGSYEGGWKNDLMHNFGTLYYQSGRIAYEGQWIDGYCHGQGTLYNEDASQFQINYRDMSQIGNSWVKYSGGFANDEREGFGTLYFHGDEKFQCFFHKDIANGNGIFFKSNGTFIKGIWKDNKLQEQI